MNKYFTVGPAQLYPTVPAHLQEALENDICSMSHRSTDFQDLFRTTVDRVKKLLNIPTDYHVFVLSSATEAMERIIQNGVEKQSFHFINGAFSKRFYTSAVQLGKDAKQHSVAFGEGFDSNAIEIPTGTELICYTHNETSTGVMLNPEDIYSFRKRNPDALLAVDIVSSVPYVNLDFRQLDSVFFSVQKGMGLPAGLGVLIVSPRAIEKAQYLKKKNISTGSYHSYEELLRYALKNQTSETPNILAIYLLSKVVDDMLTRGIATIRKEIEEKACSIYEYLDTAPQYTLLVKEKKNRSNTVIVAEVQGGSKALVEKLKEKGIILSYGYSDLKQTHVRIANFPTHTKDDVQLLLESL